MPVQDNILEQLLQLDDKVDSPERLAMFQAFGIEKYADAAHFNLLRDALIDLYQNGDDTDPDFTVPTYADLDLIENKPDGLIKKVVSTGRTYIYDLATNTWRQVAYVDNATGNVLIYSDISDDGNGNFSIVNTSYKTNGEIFTAPYTQIEIPPTYDPLGKRIDLIYVNTVDNTIGRFSGEEADPNEPVSSPVLLPEYLLITSVTIFGDAVQAQEPSLPQQIVQSVTGSVPGLVDISDPQHPKILPSSQLEALDEGNGIGWRLKGRNPANYGNIGNGAVDFSVSHSLSNQMGARGEYSHAEGGNVEAYGSYSHVEGVSSQVYGDFAHGEGEGNTVFGRAAHAEGQGNIARAESEHVGGRFGTDRPANNSPTDRLVNYGNGTGSGNRSDAWALFRNGAHKFFTAALSSITNAGKGFFMLDENARPHVHNGTEWKGVPFVTEVVKLTEDQAIDGFKRFKKAITVKEGTANSAPSSVLAEDSLGFFDTSSSFYKWFNINLVGISLLKGGSTMTNIYFPVQAPGGQFNMPLAIKQNGVTYSANATGTIELPASSGGAPVKTIKTVTDTAYTILAGDADKILHFTALTNITVTVPAGLATGLRFEGKQLGGGFVNFVGASGITILTGASEQPRTAERYSVFQIDWIGENEYMLYGKLALI